MTNHVYDVILLHPPAVYDFRHQVIFPGPFAFSVEQAQFNKVPIGMLSIADYLDRHGYKVIVDNLCDRMVADKGFDALQHLGRCSARVFAIGMHFQQHSQGALETARICKELHPDSLVIMGGLTATRFHEEIIANYPFVDAVIRGEGEKALVRMMQGVDANGCPGDTPNLTWRGCGGETLVSELLPASSDLDEFEYTRFDLLEPKTSVYPENSPPRWSLAVCRGCVYNCAICGGSAYSYRTYLGMPRPAFRSPRKIIEDIKKLNRQGVRFIGLFQDARMGGEAYWRELLGLLAGDDIELERLSLDLLVPADEEFIKAAAAIGRQVVMHICPDTGSDEVRSRLGRPYSNEELLKTVRLCHSYGLPVTTFFSAGLAGETPEQALETRKLWEQLSLLDKGFQVSSGVPVGGPIIGPIVLDPGSPAFDNPSKYGYRLLYRTLTEYVAALATPSWQRWLNYETDDLDLKAISAMILAAVRFSIDQRYAAGFYDDETAIAESARTALDKLLADELEVILSQDDAAMREQAMLSLKKRYEAYLEQPLEMLVR